MRYSLGIGQIGQSLVSATGIATGIAFGLQPMRETTEITWGSVLGTNKPTAMNLVLMASLDGINYLPWDSITDISQSTIKATDIATCAAVRIDAVGLTGGDPVGAYIRG